MKACTEQGRSERTNLAKLVLSLVIAALAIGGLGYALGQADATTTDGDYSIVLDSLNAPQEQRAAPYGQWLITHNSVSGITTTRNYGTVARTNGYDEFKTVICYNSGAYDADINLYLRTTSPGDVYTLTAPLFTVPAGAHQVISTTQTAPWMSLSVSSTESITGTTMLCGIYVQTP